LPVRGDKAPHQRGFLRLASSILVWGQVVLPERPRVAPWCPETGLAGRRFGSFGLFLRLLRRIGRIFRKLRACPAPQGSAAKMPAHCTQQVAGRRAKVSLPA
jgi:hypothetical protein